MDKIIFTGDLLGEDEVLNWLLFNRRFEALVEINRQDLDDLIGDSDYLAVLCKTKIYTHMKYVITVLNKNFL